jgi:hypothetical protein
MRVAHPMTESTTDHDGNDPVTGNNDPVTGSDTAGTLERTDDDTSTLHALAVASVALSGLGFLTLLRLADQRERTPARALGLFFTTSVESVSGGVLGLYAASRFRDSDQPGKGFLVAAAGAVLGVITTALNVNWMRTRRRI